MDVIAKFEIQGIEPVIMSYDMPNYIVSYGEKKESFDYFDEAQDCFKTFVSQAFDDYR